MLQNKRKREESRKWLRVSPPSLVQKRTSMTLLKSCSHSAKCLLCFFFFALNTDSSFQYVELIVPFISRLALADMASAALGCTTSHLSAKLSCYTTCTPINLIHHKSLKLILSQASLNPLPSIKIKKKNILKNFTRYLFFFAPSMPLFHFTDCPFPS